MRSPKGIGNRRDAEFLNDTAAAVRISFEHETPTPRTAFDAVKARLLRPGFLVALLATIGVASASLLVGFPVGHGGATDVTSASSGEASARATAAAHSSGPATPAAGPGEPRFLDADEAGRLAYRGGNYDEALARFKASIARNPSDAESMSNAAQILVRQGRVEEALPLLRRAVEVNGGRWAYRFNLARALDQTGQLDQALEQYEIAAALFPDDYATLFNLGRTYHRQGNETAAVERYRRAISLNPEEPTFHYAMALSLEKLGRNADACAAWVRFLELSPDSPDAGRVRTRIVQLQSGETEQPDTAATPSGDKPTIK